MAEQTVFASYLIRLVVDRDVVRPEYVAHVLNCPDTRQKLRASVRSSAGNYNVNTAGIRGVEVPIPSLRNQDAIVSELAMLQKSRYRLTLREREATAIERLMMGELEP